MLRLNKRQLNDCSCNGGGTNLLNSRLANQAGTATGVTFQGAGKLGFLIDPMDIPQQVVLTGTIDGSATPKTYMFLDDSIALASTLGQVDSAAATAGVEFTASGGISIAVLKKYLQTYALIVVGYNFESSKATQLTQNLRLLYNTIDGNGKTKQMFSAQSVSNMQQNANLLNVDQNFVWTHTTALKISCVANGVGGDAVVYTFTFSIVGAVPYGQLPQFLAEAKIPERSKINC